MAAQFRQKFMDLEAKWTAILVDAPLDEKAVHYHKGRIHGARELMDVVVDIYNNTGGDVG